MNSFWWKCDICKFGNAPDLKYCSNCGYPTVTLQALDSIDKQIKNSSRNYAQLTFIQKIFVFLGYLCSGVGVFLASFAPSLSWNGIGLVLVLLGVAILTTLRKTEIKVQPKLTNKRDS
jgi:F0F1-type ATP synthase assembly protein I